MISRITQEWLSNPNLQEVLKVLNADEGQARIAGGAVRNALLDQPIADIDIATTLVPKDVVMRMGNAGHGTVLTGIAHGTVTAIVGGETFEVTTLRQDIETDGRHAKVVYGSDWNADARRRDLTINALYLDADGRIFDPLGGLEDVFNQTVRFIDDAELRIKEDYLRILRFFRFFAWYGKFRPDAEGLKACARLKDGLDHLSAERIWQEISKLFAAPDPGRAVLWMRQTGVLSKVLPETEKWGIDSLPAFIDWEEKQGWEKDALLRLMVILPPNSQSVSSLSKRLKLPNAVRDRLLNWSNTDVPDAGMKEPEFQKWLYRLDTRAVGDALKIAIIKNNDTSKKYVRQLRWLNRWTKPVFPVRGRDLIDAGMEPGPEISSKLDRLEEIWLESGFEMTQPQLLERLDP